MTQFYIYQRTFQNLVTSLSCLVEQKSGRKEMIEGILERKREYQVVR